MSQKPPARVMRENPDIDQLKRQAKELLEAYRASSPEAVAEVTAYHRTATPESFALHDAQFVLARSYGFESWPKLKAAVDGVTATRLHAAVERGDLKTARELLMRRPEIVDLGRGEMRAVHMAVLRRDLEMTKLLLEFGAIRTAASGPSGTRPARTSSRASAATRRLLRSCAPLVRDEGRTAPMVPRRRFANASRHFSPAAKTRSSQYSSNTPSWLTCARRTGARCYIRRPGRARCAG